MLSWSPDSAGSRWAPGTVRAGLGVTERTRLLPARSQGQIGLAHRHGGGAPCWWILVLNGNTRQFQVNLENVDLGTKQLRCPMNHCSNTNTFPRSSCVCIHSFLYFSQNFPAERGQKDPFHPIHGFVIGSSTDIPEGAQLWPSGVKGAGEALGHHAFTSYKASFQL